jgi:hypothetical protein
VWGGGVVGPPGTDAAAGMGSRAFPWRDAWDARCAAPPQPARQASSIAAIAIRVRLADTAAPA